MGFIKGAAEALEVLFANIAIHFVAPGAEQLQDLMNENREQLKEEMANEADYLKERRKELGL